MYRLPWPTCIQVDRIEAVALFQAGKTAKQIPSEVTQHIQPTATPHIGLKALSPSGRLGAPAAPGTRDRECACLLLRLLPPPPRGGSAGRKGGKRGRKEKGSER